STVFVMVRASLDVIVVVASADCGVGSSVVVTRSEERRVGPEWRSGWVTSYVAVYTQFSPTFNMPLELMLSVAGLNVVASGSVRLMLVRSVLPVLLTVIV